MSNATNLSHIVSSGFNTLVEAALPLPCVLIYIRLDDNFFMKVSELWALEGPPKQSRSFCWVWSWSIVKFKLKDFKCVLYGCPMRPTLVISTVRTLIRGWKLFCLHLASPSMNLTAQKLCQRYAGVQLRESFYDKPLSLTN